MSNEPQSTQAPDGSVRERRPLWHRIAWPASTAAALLVGIGIGAAGDDEAHDSTLQATVEELTAERDRLQGELDDLQASESNDAAEAAEDDDRTDEETTAGGDEPSDVGSRDNPFAVGELVGNDDWEITIAEPYEAWDEIRAENQFNDPPPDGMEYYIVPVTVTYIGNDTGLPWADLDFAFVGDDNRTYSDRCGVIPDDLTDVDELYSGGTADGNVCVTVPAGGSGLWTLSTFLSEPVFFDAS